MMGLTFLFLAAMSMVALSNPAKTRTRAVAVKVKLTGGRS